MPATESPHALAFQPSLQEQQSLGQLGWPAIKGHHTAPSREVNVKLSGLVTLWY